MADRVAAQTRPRGLPDAPRRFAWFVVGALLLHLPLTPLGALIGLLSLLHPKPRDVPEEHLNAIPVSLLSPDEMARMGLGEPPPPPPPAQAPQAAPVERPEADLGEPAPKPEPPKPKPKPKPKPAASVSDGGAPDGGPKPPPPSDAGPPPPAPAASSAAPPLASAAPAPSAGPPPDAGGPAVAGRGPSGSDPMSLVGRSAQIADPNANVKLLVFNERVRPLPIAPRIGRLLSRLPQWKSFFGPTSLDPIRDVDRMYVAGPQFRVSSEVVAILEYAVPERAMRSAVDAIVHREPRGEWLDSKIPAARARADRADRIFVLPKKRLLLMVPPHLKDDAIAKAPGLDIPNVGGKAAVIAFVSNPWRAFLGLAMPLEFPKTVSLVSLSVMPTEDGGATVHIDAADSSPEQARADAGLLTVAVNTATQRNVGALGSLLFGGSTLSLIEPLKLVAEGKVIRGDARVTPRQLERLLGFAEAWVDAIEGGPPVRSSPAAPGPQKPAPAGLTPGR